MSGSLVECRMEEATEIQATKLLELSSNASRQLEAEDCKGESYKGAAELRTAVLPLQVEERTAVGTDRRKELKVSDPADEIDEPRGSSALSANTSGTPFFSPSCFNTPASSLASAEAATAYKTARSHMETADSMSAKTRFGKLDGLRARVTVDSPMNLTSLEGSAVSPIALYFPGETPRKDDVASPLKMASVELLAPEQVSHGQHDRSTKAEACNPPTEGGLEEPREKRRNHLKARRSKRKMRYSQANCLIDGKGVIVVDVPVQEVECHGRPWGDSLFHRAGSHCPDHDQYGSCLVTSRLYNDRVMSAERWLNSFRSQGSLPIDERCMDVITSASLTTPGEVSALDKLNRLLVAFNERATARAPCRMGRPYDIRSME